MAIIINVFSKRNFRKFLEMNSYKQVQVSIILTNYNYSNYIGDAILSVINQEFQSWELIIVDDNSTDDSRKVINKFYDLLPEKISVIFNNVNLGVSSCRNLGIKKSEGEFIAFLDADDNWNKDKLKTQIFKLNSNYCNLGFSNLNIINSEGITIGKRAIILDKKMISLEELLKCNFIPLSSLIFKKSILRGKIHFRDILLKNLIFNKYFSLNIKLIHEDYDFILRLFKFNKINAIHIAEPLVNYRVHSRSLSSNIISKIVSTYSIYRFGMGFGRIKSIAYLVRITFYTLKKNM